MVVRKSNQCNVQNEIERKLDNHLEQLMCGACGPEKTECMAATKAISESKEKVGSSPSGYVAPS